MMQIAFAPDDSLEKYIFTHEKLLSTTKAISSSLRSCSLIYGQMMNAETKWTEFKGECQSSSSNLPAHAETACLSPRIKRLALGFPHHSKSLPFHGSLSLSPHLKTCGEKERRVPCNGVCQL
jgi:hypothetical protein